MDKIKIKQALINLEKYHINETEMNYSDFLSGNLLDKTEVVDNDDQSHHRQSIEISDQLEEQAHIHTEHLETINKISFEPTDIVGPGAIVSVNGRCLIVAVSKPPFKVGDREFLGISVQAPIYKELKGRKKGDSFTFNNQQFIIEAVN
ncbi:hypothetical protein [Aquimarina sediminis]|uniref:hypothetical protein n=1 Tax=Aquimarina sediminis TaxID=2070536 RepID=UPI000CA03B96|nr:hypothetical protein [Aquimarina sediminis]